jgi:hypothetical protein
MHFFHRLAGQSVSLLVEGLDLRHLSVERSFLFQKPFGCTLLPIVGAFELFVRFLKLSIAHHGADCHLNEFNKWVVATGLILVLLVTNLDFSVRNKGFLWLRV